MPEQDFESSRAVELPAGARLLSIDEAVHILVTGDHPHSSRGSIMVDAALIELLRGEALIACRLADGSIAFRKGSRAPE